MNLADRIEALDAKATAGEWLAPRRTSVIGSGIIAAPVGRMVGDIFEHDNAALIVALRNAVPEIITALRLAETSSITVLPDGAPSALADRVETSAALPDVAGLVERLRRRHAQYVCCTERDAADRIESLSSQLAAAKAGPNILHIGTLLVWRGQTPGTIFIQQADGEGGEFPERDLEAICQSYYAENF